MCEPISLCATCDSEPNIYTTDEGWQARCSENEGGPAITACPEYVSVQADSYAKCVEEWNDRQSFIRAEAQS